MCFLLATQSCNGYLYFRERTWAERDVSNYNCVVSESTFFAPKTALLSPIHEPSHFPRERYISDLPRSQPWCIRLWFVSLPYHSHHMTWSCIVGHCYGYVMGCIHNGIVRIRQSLPYSLFVKPFLFESQ